MEIQTSGKTITLSGFLNERTDLTAFAQFVEEAGDARIIINMVDIEKANSTGLLTFVKILGNSKVCITFEEAPIWLVEQLNIVEEMLAPSTLVSSLQARFYCPANNKNSNHILKVGTDIPILDSYSKFELTLTDAEGLILEPDFDVPSYFNFIAVRAAYFRKELAP